MKKNLHFKAVESSKIASNLFLRFFVVLFSIIFISYSELQSQSVLYSAGNTSICNGQSTTLKVNVDGGSGPYTVVYSDGTNNFTVNNYNSNDTDGDDAISINPTTNTTYQLISVSFGSNNSLPVSSSTVSITVNQLPSNIVVTSPTASVCSGVSFNISATATNADYIELWNNPKVTKISDLPYSTSITSNTTYTLVAVSSQGCTAQTTHSVVIDNVAPTPSCKNKTIYLNGSGTASLIATDIDNNSTDNCVITE